tara:strand:+ start:1170 stop:1994 length:825 start_codon:yes stop_codon:yes gene_type:complete
MSMTISSPTGLTDQTIAETLIAGANAARASTLGRFRTQLAVDNKFSSGFDPVTEADREAEMRIREVIAARFPDHGIIGEEWDTKDTATRFNWIIDPIDGTRAFISGVPVWGTLIGLTHEGKAIAGLMEQPYTGERWLAVGGRLEHTRNDQPVPTAVSTVTKLSQARTSTTDPGLFSGPQLSAWTQLSARALQVRYGLDCYAYCLLASGHIDLVVEAGLKDVDIAPLIPIIEAAGGIVTTWDGGRAERGGTCIAAATEQLHEEAMRVLRDAMLDQ